MPQESKPEQVSNVVQEARQKVAATRRRWYYVSRTAGVILFTGWRWWRILLLVVSASFVVLVGPSRIYLGDHWASDVLGSYLIGGVLLGMTLWIYLRLKREGVLQTERARKTTQRSRLLRSFPWK